MLKITLTSYIIFFFASFSANAGNLSSFSIESMKIGDRADEHFSGRELANAIHGGSEGSDPKFYYHGFRGHESFLEYDYVRVITTPDKSLLFNIAGIAGLIYYEEVDECYKKKDEILSELNKNLNGVDFEGPLVGPFSGDPSGNSTYEEHLFYPEGGFARIACYDMDVKMDRSDTLLFEVLSKAAWTWLISNIFMS